jgi:NAD(P)H-hydrate epimerase
MAIALPETPDGSIDISALDALRKATNKKSAILLGPGLSTDKSTSELAKQLLPALKLPMVIDADGLNALDGNIDLITQRKAPTVITPHPGEMSRLTGRTVKEIESDRIGAAQKLSDKTGAIVLLKGAGTVVAAPGESSAYINNTGTAALATAGSGDVLSGIIGGLLAQGVEPKSAAVLAAFIHGELASAYEAEHGNGRSMIAGDLIQLLPKVIGELLSAV